MNRGVTNHLGAHTVSLEHSLASQKKKIGCAIRNQPEDPPSLVGREPKVPPAPKPKRLLRLPEVLARTGMKQSQWFDAVARGVVPKPVHPLPGGRAVAWVESEIDALIDARIAERDQAAALAEAPTAAIESPSKPSKAKPTAVRP
jgi:prophage regulatory protein